MNKIILETNNLKKSFNHVNGKITLFENLVVLSEQLSIYIPMVNIIILGILNIKKKGL